VARHWLRKNILMMSRGMAIRKEMEKTLIVKNKQVKAYSDPEEKSEDEYYKSPFIDVEYRKLLKDPIAELRRIYDFAGLTMDKKLEQDVHDYLEEENVHKKYGRHEYRLEDFGLEPSDLDDPAFENYRAPATLSS